MTENDFDEALLRNAFSGYRAETAPQIKPAGVAAASESVRHRRRVRAVIVAAGAALLFALPVAAYAIASRPTGPPTPPLESPSPSPTPTVTTVPPTSSPPTPTPTGPTDNVPNGGFSMEQLRNATFTVPSWDDTAYPAESRCTSGSRKFTSGLSEPGVWLTNLSYVDLEKDGLYETIVTLRCRRAGETGPEQLIVLARSSGDQIRTLGQVVTTKQGIAQIGFFEGLPDGRIRVQVRNNGLCCSEPFTASQHQWRYYSWNGQSFAQTSGSTAFHPATAETDLVVTTTELTFGKVVGGIRTGTVSVTIRNAGPMPASDVLLVVGIHNTRLTTQGFIGWTGNPMLNYKLERNLGPLAVGESRTIELTLTTLNDDPLSVEADFMSIALGPDADYLRDLKPHNNQRDDQQGIAATVKFS